MYEKYVTAADMAKMLKEKQIIAKMTMKIVNTRLFFPFILSNTPPLFAWL